MIGVIEIFRWQTDFYFQFPLSLHWLGPLLARVAVGVLFFISGQGKLANPAGMRQTMQESGVPLAKFNAIFVPLVELIGGAGLILGLLTPLWCFMLIVVMLVALVTVHIPTMQARTLSAWLASFLYLPEVLYLVVLVWLFLAGPGGLSADALLFR